MTKEEQAKILLKKYEDGEASAAEIKQVERWYAAYENSNQHIAENRKAEMGKEIFLGLQGAMENHTAPKALHLSAWIGLLKVAAVLLLVSGVAAAVWPGGKTTGENLFSISTTATQRKNIVLADGSEIKLGPSAKIVYPARFKADSRSVELAEGEAFFNIAHDEHRPFTVKTGQDLYTKVLGTSFNIKSYGVSRKICIAVVTGKVAVGNGKQVFGTLIKGQRITYDKKDLRAVIDYIPEPVYTNIAFEGETLLKVCQRLEYAYSIHINLGSTDLNSLKCTATFNTKQTPEEIMDLLCSLHHLKVSKSDHHKTYNLYRK